MYVLVWLLNSFLLLVKEHVLLRYFKHLKKVLKTRTQNIGQQAKPTQNKTIFIHINGGERSRGLSPCKPKFIC